MPITAIDFTTKKTFNGFTPKKTLVESNSMNRVSTSNNELRDYNYGKSLVVNNVSFKGAPVLASDIGRKIKAGLEMMNQHDIMLIGKNVEESSELLSDSLSSVSNYIKRILFIKADDLKKTLAVRLNGINIGEVTHLNEGQIFLMQESKGSPIIMNKGDWKMLFTNDTLTADGVKIQLPIISSGAEVKKLQQEFIKTYDFTNFNKSELDNINRKHLNLISGFVEQEKAKGLTLDDIGGQDKAVEEIMTKIILPLRYPSVFKDMANIRSAVLVGPPGNGKTHTARVLANVAGVDFFNLNPQLLEDMYVGNSAKNIHAYYENLLQHQPCICFFDEADATFKRRTGANPHGEDSLNMHLAEITRLEQMNAQVFVLAATNKLGAFDPAALRGGRFSTKILFDNPDVEGCKAVFKIHTKGVDIKDLDLDEFAKKLVAEKVSNADIASNIISEAKLFSMKRLGIYDKMKNGTFKAKSDFKLTLNGEDLEKALLKYKEGKKLVEESIQNNADRVDFYESEIKAKTKAMDRISTKTERKPIGYSEYLKRDNLLNKVDGDANQG